MLAPEIDPYVGTGKPKLYTDRAIKMLDRLEELNSAGLSLIDAAEKVKDEEIDQKADRMTEFLTGSPAIWPDSAEVRPNRADPSTDTG